MHTVGPTITACGCGAAGGARMPKGKRILQNAELEKTRAPSETYAQMADFCTLR